MTDEGRVITREDDGTITTCAGKYAWNETTWQWEPMPSGGDVVKEYRPLGGSPYVTMADDGRVTSRHRPVIRVCFGRWACSLRDGTFIGFGNTPTSAYTAWADKWRAFFSDRVCERRGMG